MTFCIASTWHELQKWTYFSPCSLSSPPATQLSSLFYNTWKKQLSLTHTYCPSEIKDNAHRFLQEPETLVRSLYLGLQIPQNTCGERCHQLHSVPSIQAMYKRARSAVCRTQLHFQGVRPLRLTQSLSYGCASFKGLKTQQAFCCAVPTACGSFEEAGSTATGGRLQTAALRHFQQRSKLCVTWWRVVQSPTRTFQTPDVYTKPAALFTFLGRKIIHTP